MSPASRETARSEIPSNREKSIRSGSAGDETHCLVAKVPPGPAPLVEDDFWLVSRPVVV